MDDAYDAVVIGAGHNGLVASAYLAEAGLKVLVLERRPLVGGAAVTEELHPGFRFSRASYVLSLFRPEIVSHLELARHGLVLLPRDPSSFTPFPDGRFLLLGPDAAANEREIAKFSTRDARRFAGYEAMLDRVARRVEPLLDWTPPALAHRRPADLARLVRMGWWVARLGRDLPDVVELLLGSARTLLDRWFESDALKATLATDAIIGAMVSPRMAGTAYVLLHHVMGETGGQRGVWAYVRGGMGGLSEALAAAARERGAIVKTEMPVRKVLVEAGRAVGVELEHGKEVRAGVVVSNADPVTTFLGLVPPEALPEQFRERVAAIDMSSPAVKINVALSELPSFTALPGRDCGDHHTAGIILGPSLGYMDRAYCDARTLGWSREPIIEMVIPSTLDDTLAPAGGHVASLFCQHVAPQLPAGRSWNDHRETVADLMIETVDRYAAGFKASVIGRQVLSPFDLEQVFGLTGGDIFHGALTLDQLFWARPAVGYADYRGPLKGLYHCGSGAHPGGGVTGAPGHNAARAIIADRHWRLWFSR
jgi:phytoene dehydrogenase-like protein